MAPAGSRHASFASSSLTALVALGCAVALLAWLRARRGVLRGPAAPGPRHAGLLAVALALAFRLPLAWQGGAGYVTADGALSGIVALDARDGRAHHVFVPEVPYTGSLKSHLTAPLAAVIDPARAFALVSAAFYALFVAALVALVRRADGGPFVAVAAGLYAAFAPPFVTRYSLSNDGNYVEVLALGTAALLLAARWGREEAGGRTLATAAGLLLGLAFWCHILAVIHVAAVGLTMLVTAPRRAVRDSWRVALGFALGDAPGLFWNAYHGGESFLYLVPGAVTSGAAAGAGTGGLARLAGVVQDHLPVLVGYDFGYPRPVDLLLRVIALGTVAAAAAGWIAAARAAGRGNTFWRALVVLAVVNLLVAALALPYIPGNARYVLFLTAPVAAFVARALRARWLRPALVVLVLSGAAGSLAQAAGTLAADREWRAFVAALRAEGVRWCYTDFFLATKINFLSEERHHLLVEAGADHHRVLPPLPRRGGGRPGGGPRRRQPDRGGQAGAPAGPPGCPLRDAGTS